MPININTEGIVLHSFKYNETSIITRIYTKELGLQSYLVPGVRKKKSTIKYTLFQPLSTLEMIVYHNDKPGLQRIKEISCFKKYQQIPTDIKKTTIALFLSEILINCLKEQEANTKLFEFLKQSLFYLDNSKDKVSGFHLLFLMQLTKYLGFYPNLKQKNTNSVFNLKEGICQNNKYNSQYCLDKQSSDLFEKLCQMKYEDLNEFSLPTHYKKTLLEKIITYYKLHVEGFKDIKSLKVLEAVFD